jgi:hypothetical protein
LKVGRGDTVKIINRLGRISVTGWDGETLEASARGEHGDEKIKVHVTKVANHELITLSLPHGNASEQRHARNSGAAQTNAAPARSPDPGSEPREIQLEVKLPRHIVVEMIDARSSDVDVSNMDAAVTIESTEGDIKASDVGALSARTRNGTVLVERASATVDVSSTSGDLSVSEVGADLRALSVSGHINVRCARGFVEATTTYGAITLTNSGPVEANTADGDIVFTGVVRADGRYKLRSLGGDIRMDVQEAAAVSAATLSSYAGKIESTLRLVFETSATNPEGKRRIGRYGSGPTQIALDSFDGKVTLNTVAGRTAEGCREQ